MATKAFQKIYTKISQITKATCSLKATGVGYDELATVNGKLAQVVKIMGDEVTLQVFQGTEGIPTNAEVVFLGKSPSLKVFVIGCVFSTMNATQKFYRRNLTRKSRRTKKSAVIAKLIYSPQSKRFFRNLRIDRLK